MAPAPVGPAGKSSAPVARPVKTRYFKGKPGAAVASDSDSDGDDGTPLPTRRVTTAPKLDLGLVAGGAGRLLNQDVPTIKMELGRVKIPDGGVTHAIGDQSSDQSETELEAKPHFVSKTEDQSSEYETDSDEESEEERKPAFRPVFVSKTARKTISAEQQAREVEEKERKEEEEREQRKLDSKELAGETIKRELAEKEVSSELIADVDDTDGLDPEAEFEEWRARELARLLREKNAQAEADAELEEIERRRAMPEDVRMAEDLEYAAKTRESEKGEMGFLQKYYHKGAFHQDDELLKRDYTAATESQVDMQMLPKVMQVRDFGKASRTKYTHLTDQDTSSGGWGTGHQAFARPGEVGTTQTGCWNCGGPHMRQDCPNNNINDPNLIAGVSIPGRSDSASGGLGTSANRAALGGAAGSSRWAASNDSPSTNDSHSSHRPSDHGWDERRTRGHRKRDTYTGGHERRADGDSDKRSRDGGRHRSRSPRPRDIDDRGPHDRERDRGLRGDRERDRREERHSDRHHERDRDRKAERRRGSRERR